MIILYKFYNIFYPISKTNNIFSVRIVDVGVSIKSALMFDSSLGDIRITLSHGQSDCCRV